MVIFSAVLIVIIFALDVLLWGGMLGGFFDVPSLIVLVLSLIMPLIGAGCFADFFRPTSTLSSFGGLSKSLRAISFAARSVALSALMSSAFALAMVFSTRARQTGGSPSFGAGIALILCVTLYAAFLELILLFRKRKIEILLGENSEEGALFRKPPQALARVAFFTLAEVALVLLSDFFFCFFSYGGSESLSLIADVFLSKAFLLGSGEILVVAFLLLAFSFLSKKKSGFSNGISRSLSGVLFASAAFISALNLVSAFCHLYSLEEFWNSAAVSAALLVIPAATSKFIHAIRF